jgi:PPE-repeat protein
MLDFGALPPEINSGLMYAGPGSGPMMAAAAAWTSLAAELSTAASSYQAVISELTGGPWLGPSSASMAAAAEPYVVWMNYTAEAAQHAATQATASAAAYETAFAMTVPPPVIAANRAQLTALVATNFLGQNTPAIMATEAHYGEMWAQDAAAMYGYAASSASAATLQPLPPPAPTTNPAGPALQAGTVAQATASTAGTQAGLSQLVSSLPGAVGGLANPMSAVTGSSDPGILSSINNLLGVPFVQNTINSVDVTVAWNVMMLAATMPLLGHFVANNPVFTISDVSPLGAGLGSGTVLAGAVGHAGAGEVPVLAGMGQASSVGGLSVPAAWSSATPMSTPASSAAALTGAGWTAAPESEPVTTLPAGMPAVASATRGAAGFGAPRYGVKPTVMPKPVGVG